MSLPTIPLLLNWWWQSTLVLAVGWLWYYLVLRREGSFAYNRWLLLLTPGLALLLPLLLPALAPLLRGWLPAHAPPLLPTVTLPAVLVGSDGRPGADFDAAAWALGAYAGGAGLLLARLALQLSRLARITRGLPQEAHPSYVLVRTGGRLPVSSFGRRIFWDDTAAYSAAEADLVLRHELAHVQQHHSADRLLLEVLRALLWPTLLVHLFPGALELTHEYLADAAVLQEEPPAAAAYGALLARLTLQRSLRPPSLTHSFTYSQTLNRIAMLRLTSPTRRWKQWLPLPVAALLLLTLSATHVAAQRRPVPLRQQPSATAAEKEKVYESVEQVPAYPGGDLQLVQDIGTHTKYPASAKAAQLGGRMFVRFVIGSDGLMRDITLLKGIAAPAGQEQAAHDLEAAGLQAVRQLQPRWTPGRDKGRAVAVSMTLPVSFAP